MKYLPCLFFCFFLTRLPAYSQKLQLLVQHTNTSIRGLSVVNDQIIWVSGSQGTVGKSLDSGKTWEWIVVKNYEKRDFRDIEAFDDHRAFIMAVAEPAVILKTLDGGISWQPVFSDSTAGMFLDAMDFQNERYGLVIGDPIHQKLYLASTEDSGNHWTRIDEPQCPILADGEAFFAASGSNIRLLTQGDPGFIFVSGGKKSRLWMKRNEYSSDSLPIIQGKESTGANAIALWDDHNGIVVGGDFSNDTSSRNNCVIFHASQGITYSIPRTPPHGYRSSVCWLNRNRLVCCGTSGVDISWDGGKNWQWISRDGYHVCQKAKSGMAVFLAGPHGKIARLIW